MEFVVLAKKETEATWVIGRNREGQKSDCTEQRGEE